jgi:hypothetical protein
MISILVKLKMLEIFEILAFDGLSTNYSSLSSLLELSNDRQLEHRKPSTCHRAA